MSKRSGGVIGCKYKTFSWHLNEFPYGSNIGSKVFMSLSCGTSRLRIVGLADEAELVSITIR